MTNDPIKKRLTFIKNEWNDRAKKMGSNLNSVLFKRCPDVLNSFIDKQHYRFINSNIDLATIQLLDVGCGFGRLSKKIQDSHPTAKVCGIDISENFVEMYNREVGMASCVALQDFEAHKKFNLIFVVTVLMYLEKGQLDKNIYKLWDYLSPGGLIIVIEPASEFQSYYRRISNKNNAGSTGGDVLYFSKNNLATRLQKLPNISHMRYKSVSLIPFTDILPIHHMYALKKSANSTAQHNCHQ